ncbi:MAG: hypothetical protein WAO91_08820 [Candidatus Nitrosotenuis sp.]
MKSKIFKKPWDELTPKQKALRERSLAVLVEAKRTRKSAAKIAKDHGIPFRTVLSHTNAFKKVNGRWAPKRFDKVSRSMLISENGKLQSVLMSDSRHARTIGKYHNAVKQYLNTGDKTKLNQFSKKQIRDSSGKLHSFETNPKLVLEINEKIEEIEFFKVYDS